MPRERLRGMRPPVLLVVCVSLASAGCPHESSRSSRAADPRSPAIATCTPVGAEHAHALTVVDLPNACRFSRGGAVTDPLIVRDAAGLSSVVECTGAAPPAIDLVANDLYLVEYAMSPASRGVAPLDDGATVHMTTRFRQPCPGDPLPMPMNATVAFLLAKNAKRTFRSATCTLPGDCR